MAAPTLETNAAADTLRIMGGNAGNPVTWDDVWDWDDGGGSSGGDGDVPKDGGGTAKVNTFMTEIVADAIYLILKHINFGDGSIPTYFASIGGEVVVFSDDYKPVAYANATCRLGELAGGYGINGSFWSVRFTSPGTYLFTNGATVWLIYGSTIYQRPVSADVELKWNSGSIAVNSNVFGSANRTYPCPAFSFGEGLASCSIITLYVNYCQELRMRVPPSICSGLHVHYTRTGIYVLFADITAIEAEITSSSVADIKIYGAASSVCTLIDPVLAPSIQILTNGEVVWLKYTYNIHVTDKDGANLAGAVVDCEDQFGNPVWAAGTVITDGAGNIVEQIITYRRWIDIAETLTTYSPHKFTISKAGYETLELDDVTVDAPVVWHLELLPALAASDVRDGLSFLEDRTGSLDLPSINDVEDGVFFDSGTKEGNFEAPAEEDVEVGVGYGSLGTEFEGTYLGLRGSNLTAYLSESVSLTGELKP